MNAITPPRIDRDSPMPVYQQIANDIVLRINQEEWLIGDKIPSESELVKEYGASRVTVRQALSKLENEGLIDKQRGRGAFLKANPRRSIQELNLPQIGVKQQSENTTDNVVLSVVFEASPQVYSYLELEQGHKLIYLERNFLRKGKIVGINRAWFPYDLVPGMEKDGLIDGSVTTTLWERYNLQFSSVENYIESVMINATTAEQLDTISPSPALRISTIYKIKNSTPVQYSVTTWNGRDTTFWLNLSSE